MKIFILEDNPERIKFFKEVYKHHEVYFSCNIAESLLILSQKEFAVIFLDHDIEEEEKLTSYNNGYELVKKMIEFNLQKQAIVYVHSMNPCKGQIMANLLDDNGYKAQWVPYHLLKMEDK